MSDSNGRFPPIWKSVTVEVPGFEDVTVAYNVMAVAGKYLKLQNSMSQEAADGIIGEIANWPEGAGEGPFDVDHCPMAVRAWICIDGPGKALAMWRRDPNS